VPPENEKSLAATPGFFVALYAIAGLFLERPIAIAGLFS
jgi:hypothetical protein